MSGALPGPSFVSRTGPRIIGILVQGDIKNIISFVKYILSAVAVMQVPVDDGHPLHIPFGKGIGCPDGNIIENAKPHGSAGIRMMARRADRAEYLAEITTDNPIHRFHHSPVSFQSGLFLVGGKLRVGIEHNKPPGIEA